jgi:hypothetical protein
MKDLTAACAERRKESRREEVEIQKYSEVVGEPKVRKNFSCTKTPTTAKNG